MPAILGAAAIRVTIAPRSSRDLDRTGGGPLATLTGVVETEVPSPEDLTALGEPIARLLRTMADDLHHIASQLDGDSVDAGFDPAGIGSAAERRRTWLAARAAPAYAPLVPDLPTPKRRRLFF